MKRNSTLIAFILMMFAASVNGQHITNFFDSIPGLSDRYNMFLATEGQPDSVLWMKDAVDTYFDTGLETFDAFALFKGDDVTVIYHKEDSFGPGGSRRPYIRAFKYRIGGTYFSLEWGHDLQSARPLLFGENVESNWDQFIGQPLEKEVVVNPSAPYTVTVHSFSDPKRLQSLLMTLDAWGFKYKVE